MYSGILISSIPTWKRQFGSSYWEVCKIEGKIMHECLSFEGKLDLV